MKKKGGEDLKRIHLVFPEPVIRQGLPDALREAGYDVVDVDYTLAGFAKATNVGADVALVNIFAARRDKAETIELFREIRRTHPRLRIIVLLPESDRDDRAFREALVRLAVYDIRYATEFGVDDLVAWIETEMTVADHLDLNLEDVRGAIPEPAPAKEPEPPKKRGLFGRKKPEEKPVKKKAPESEKPGLFARLFSRKKRDEAPPPPPPPSPPPAVRDGVLVFADPAMERAVRKAGFRVVSDPRRALLAVATPDRAAFAPSDLPLLILRTGAASDVLIAARYPNARLIAEEELEDELRALLGEPAPEPERPVLKREPEASPQAEPERPADPEPSPQAPPPPVPPPTPSPQARSVRVIPGKGKDDRLTVPGRGVIYVVSPGDPGLAGETAARIARALPKSALVCAGGMSTAAIALGIPEAVLVEADWRIPGAKAPLEKDGVTVWPVDPEKFLDVRDALPNALVSQIRSRFAVTVVDAAGDLTLTAGAPRNAVVIVLKSGSELVDRLTDRWLREHGKNALVVLPHETVRVEPFGDGAIVRKIDRFSAAALENEN